MHLKRGNTEKLKTQVTRILEMLNDPRLVDSLKGVFTLTIDVKEQIEDTRKKMTLLLEKLQK